MWLQEITSDGMGTIFYLGLKESLELDELYYKIKYKYDVLYKELKIENERVIKALLIVVLLISIGLNILELTVLFRW